MVRDWSLAALAAPYQSASDSILVLVRPHCRGGVAGQVEVTWPCPLPVRPWSVTSRVGLEGSVRVDHLEAQPG